MAPLINCPMSCKPSQKPGLQWTMLDNVRAARLATRCVCVCVLQVADTVHAGGCPTCEVPEHPKTHSAPLSAVASPRKCFTSGQVRPSEESEVASCGALHVQNDSLSRLMRFRRLRVCLCAFGYVGYVGRGAPARAVSVKPTVGVVCRAAVQPASPLKNRSAWVWAFRLELAQVAAEPDSIVTAQKGVDKARADFGCALRGNRFMLFLFLRSIAHLKSCDSRKPSSAPIPAAR